MKPRTIVIILFFEVLALIAVPALAGASTADGTQAGAGGRSFRLKLVGTAIADDPEVSVAVIESGLDGKHRSYHEGEQIGGILIIEILRDRIIVKTEKGEGFISLSQPLTLIQSLTTKSEQPLERPPVPVVSGIRFSRNLRQQTVYFDGKSLAAELSRSDDIIQEVNIDSVSVYGRPAGVKISAIEPDGIFSKIGLKNGEVIKEVNGMEVTRPEQAMAVLKKLKAGDNVDIKVKGRRTRRIQLVVE